MHKIIKEQHNDEVFWVAVTPQLVDEKESNTKQKTVIYLPCIHIYVYLDMYIDVYMFKNICIHIYIYILYSDYIVNKLLSV